MEKAAGAVTPKSPIVTEFPQRDRPPGRAVDREVVVGESSWRGLIELGTGRKIERRGRDIR
jgi:hypothetical protein